MKDKGALYWLLFLAGFPIIAVSTLSYLFEPTQTICWISVLPPLLIFFFWNLFGHVFRKPTRRLDWDENKSVEETDRGKPSSEKYSPRERSTKKGRGLFTSIFSKEDECEKCGAELVYKEGAGSYYCPECQEYKWR